MKCVKSIHPDRKTTAVRFPFHLVESCCNGFHCFCFRLLCACSVFPSSFDKAMPRKKKNDGDPEWATSKAKMLLEKDLLSGSIPLDAADMEPREVYLQRPEFSEIEYTKFRTNLNSLRKSHREAQSLADSDLAALQHDLVLHPIKQTNHRGEPRWEGSDAQRLLRLDMDEGMHYLMGKPQYLWSTRPEYKAYSKTVFRGHIDQEERLRKFINYLEYKRNIKYKKKKKKNQEKKKTKNQK